jgi:hypothetical protein
MSPVRYELGFYIPEDSILRSHCCENLLSYVVVHNRWYTEVANLSLQINRLLIGL